MTPGETRASVLRSDKVYKMSLGITAEYEAEALKSGCLVFGSEANFYEAVLTGNETEITAAGRRLTSDSNSAGNASDGAIRVWKQTIQTFNSLPQGALVLHWEAKKTRLLWGLTQGGFNRARKEPGRGGNLTPSSTCP